MKDKSVILQLLFDSPCSIDRVGLNAEQKRLLGDLIDVEEQVNKKFANDEEALNLFEKFKSALNDLNFEETCCCFERWIRFGIKFGMELAKE